MTSSIINDTAYGSGWDADTTHAPTKNAVYDKISAMDTTIAWKQATLVSGTNIKTVNNNSLLGSWNITISWWHDYSWNTLTGTSFTLSWTNYRNLISTSSDTTVSVWTGLTPWMEYIIRITNSDSDNDHTMTFNSVAYIIPKSWTVTYKWLALTATTVEFEWPRYVYSMPATPEEWFIYYVLPGPEHPRTPWANTLAYYPLKENGNDASWKWNNLTAQNITYSTLWWVTTAIFAWTNTNGFSWAVANIPQGNSDMTISLWCYLDNSSIPSGNYIDWTLWRYWTAGYNNMRALAWFTGWINGNVISQYWTNSSRLWDTKTQAWTNIIVTYSSSTFTLYQDGVSKWTWSYNISTSWNTLRIWWLTAWASGSYIYAWKWWIRDFIIEDKARTADEISTYYNKSKSDYWL